MIFLVSGSISFIRSFDYFALIFFSLDLFSLTTSVSPLYFCSRLLWFDAVFCARPRIVFPFIGVVGRALTFFLFFLASGLPLYVMFSVPPGCVFVCVSSIVEWVALHLGQTYSARVRK